MHVGTWGLAIIVVVIVSWLMYRYFAPRSWKEWTRAGVLQAFIIAFYAEMYGFPLTIYFLARFLGVDVAWTEGGNLWAQLFGTPVAHLVAMAIGRITCRRRLAPSPSGATREASGHRRCLRSDAPPTVHRPVSDCVWRGHRALAHDRLGHCVPYYRGRVHGPRPKGGTADAGAVRRCVSRVPAARPDVHSPR